MTEIDLTGNITNVIAREGATFEIDTQGNITGVQWPEGATFETDVKGNITSATTPEGTVYTVNTEGHITSVSKPDGVTYSVDAQGNITGITTPDGASFTVDTRGNVTSITTGGEKPFTVDCTGNIKDVSWPEGSTYETDVTGNVTGINTPDGTTYTVDAAGNITSVTTQSGVTYSVDGSGMITAVSLDPNTVLPTVDLQATATVSKVNFEEGKYTVSGNPQLEYEASQNTERRGGLGNTIFSAPQTAEDVHNLAEAIRDYNTAAEQAQAAMEGGDILGYNEWSQEAESARQSIQNIGNALGNELGTDNGAGFQAWAQGIANGMQLLSDGSFNDASAAEFTGFVDDILTVLNDDNGSAAAAAGNFGATVQEGLSNALNENGWDTTAVEVVSSIETALASASSNLTQAGDDIAAGIGEGETAHDFSGDAESTIANDEMALRSAAGAHSPAARFNPVGEDIAAGVGQGMSRHDFSAAAETVIGAIQSPFAAELFSETGALVAFGLAEGMASADMGSAGSAVSNNVRNALFGAMSASAFAVYGTTAASGVAQGITSYSFASAGSTVANAVRSSVAGSLNSSTLMQIGRNAMAGLASGIRSGSAEVVSAMRTAAQNAVSAAKEALKIQSPSRVFRDEVGTMVMKGFGEGVTEESRRQAMIISNAARYLTSAAREGTMGAASDNRRTYNNQSSVTMTGNTFIIRNEDDARNLAIQIANLTKKQQAGYGANGVSVVNG